MTSPFARRWRPSTPTTCAIRGWQCLGRVPSGRTCARTPGGARAAGARGARVRPLRRHEKRLHAHALDGGVASCGTGRGGGRVSRRSAPHRAPRRTAPRPRPRGGAQRDLGQTGPAQLGRARPDAAHAYYTDRILARSPALGEAAAIAGAAHERLGGAGYPRRLSGSGIDPLARILAAADVFHALTEERPHRAAFEPAAAARALADEASAGRLDATAVRRVLDPAGAPRPPIVRQWPAGLTDREIDVLRQLVRGHTNKEIAAALRLSARTVQHHSIRIYAKIGVESRAGAALFAMEHDLVLPAARPH
jgi:DNA-binding CsgD family transcriptional regulator